MSKYRRLGVAQTPTRAIARRFETMEEILEDRRVQLGNRKATAQQQDRHLLLCARRNRSTDQSSMEWPPASHSCSCSCPTEALCVWALCRAIWTCHKHFKWPLCHRWFQVYPQHLILHTRTQPSFCKTNPGPGGDAPAQIHGLLRSMFLLLPCHGRMPCLYDLDYQDLKKKRTLIALWWSELSERFSSWKMD